VENRFSVKTTRVKAVGPAGDSLTVGETCAWSDAQRREPVKQGLCTMKYADGKPMATRYYRSGRLDGPVKAWYPDGTPWLDGRYDRDVPTGKWRTWTRGGQPPVVGRLCQGRKGRALGGMVPGRAAQIEILVPQRQGGRGVSGMVPQRARPGCAGSSGPGRREGREAAWYPDGARLYSARYAAGQLDGDFYQWHPGGKLRLHCRFAKGRKDGSSRVWYPSGILQEQPTTRTGD